MQCRRPPPSLSPHDAIQIYSKFRTILLILPHSSFIFKIAVRRLCWSRLLVRTIRDYRSASGDIIPSGEGTRAVLVRCSLGGKSVRMGGWRIIQVVHTRYNSQKSGLQNDQIASHLVVHRTTLRPPSPGSGERCQSRVLGGGMADCIRQIPVCYHY